MKAIMPCVMKFTAGFVAGELVRTHDKLRGEIKYEYEANGQLHSRDTGRLVDSEEFRYDAAANRLNFNTSQFDQVKDNRIKQWRDQEYTYDAWGIIWILAILLLMMLRFMNL